MKNNNLIFSVFSLLATMFLLVCIVTAWYATNTEADASGIFGSTLGNNYSLKLQRAKVDNEGNVIDWIQTDNLAFSNINPGNVFLFRIELNTDKEVEFNVRFADVSSSLVSNKLVAIDDWICLNQEGYKLYKLENNQVIIQDKILYEYREGEVKLKDYLIHNTIYFYELKEEPTTTTIPNELNGTILPNVSNYNISSTDELKYFYFALEFNEELSLVEIDGYESSNCYLYQKLTIGYISITKI